MVLETDCVNEENLPRSSSSRSLTGSVRILTESVKKTAGIGNIAASVVLQHWSSITVSPYSHKDSVFRCRRAVEEEVLYC